MTGVLILFLLYSIIENLLLWFFLVWFAEKKTPQKPQVWKCRDVKAPVQKHFLFITANRYGNNKLEKENYTEAVLLHQAECLT